ncbi:tyrosine-type recombinase/integrase [uncultured Jannaschia sp.]|uniref:tyrosine-type recombinase/integrase n=1 Tax=uncultured Jannaschia sp. TaxID=293347 RepID=UPI00260E0776|nr:tyrosine-type recombinase/integrase [uncultured Jannaschia sp.]
MKRRRQFPGATPYTDRHGTRRWRFRKGGFSAELGKDYGSDDFAARYEAAMQGEKTRGLIGAERTVPLSFDALVASYYQSKEWLGLGDTTRRSYRGVIEAMRVEHGRKRIAGLKRRHVKALMAEKAETPAAANNRLKRLRQLLDHALDLEWIETNPARGVKMYELPQGGFHTWDEGEIVRFLDVHAPGTLAHRAMMLMLYTGASRKDACALGWGNIRGHRLIYRRGKTVKRTGIVIDIPLHPDLVPVLDACPSDAFTFLQTRQGASRSPGGLGKEMRKWCDAADLPDCASHGLRKGIARRMAELGLSGPQIIAVTGHKTISEVQPYIDKADRRLGGEQAMKALAGTKPAQTLANHPERFAKISPKNLK